MTETSAPETAVAAGPVTFLVEHRTVGAGSGPTIRVVGADDSHEYLRFDMFSEGPHYHYSPPTTPDSEATERILKLDTVADGEAVALGDHHAARPARAHARGGRRRTPRGRARRRHRRARGRRSGDVGPLHSGLTRQRSTRCTTSCSRAARGSSAPDDAFELVDRVGGVEAVDGGEHLLDVEPVLRAVEHRFAHHEMLRSEDRDRVGTERHRLRARAHRLVERVVGEEQVDRRAAPTATDLSLALGQRSGQRGGVDTEGARARRRCRRRDRR